MPVSDYNNIPAILDRIVTAKPKSILDLGIGWGKWGCLVREVLDAVDGRISDFESAVDIVGVEGFVKYSNPNWKNYTGGVNIENFAAKVNWHHYVNFDMVLAIDCLEHLPKGDAVELINYLVENNRELIISVPLGNCPQGDRVGNLINPLECHLSTWIEDDKFLFKKYNVNMLRKGICMVLSIKQ